MAHKISNGHLRKMMKGRSGTRSTKENEFGAQKKRYPICSAVMLIVASCLGSLAKMNVSNPLYFLREAYLYQTTGLPSHYFAKQVPDISETSRVAVLVADLVYVLAIRR